MQDVTAEPDLTRREGFGGRQDREPVPDLGNNRAGRRAIAAKWSHALGLPFPGVGLLFHLGRPPPWSSPQQGLEEVEG